MDRGERASNKKTERAGINSTARGNGADVCRKTLPLVVILGPTASGKSVWAVQLARRFGGEIISADSRQVYRGLDIGTGKITKREMRGIPHHLLSIQNPKRAFSADQFRNLAERKIDDIRKRGKMPLLVGGTGFYIDAVARGLRYPAVPPQPALRRALSRVSPGALHRILRNLDPARAKTVDRLNPRRLIRAIEIAKTLGAPIPKLVGKEICDVLFIGIKRSRPALRKRIRAAIKDRMRRGLVRETRTLMRFGLSPKRLAALGIDYGIAANFIRHKIPRKDMVARLEAANWHYAKRQETWFKRYRDIHWIRSRREAGKLITRFLEKPSAKKRL